MELARTLLALEEDFWRASGDRDRYEANLAADAVHVFPGWGIADPDRVLSAVEAVEPWETFEIEDAKVVRLGDDAAAIVYHARARRAGQPEYVAAIISVYRRRDDAWELVLHQQTPLPAADE
jgi:hypothetical protein